MSGQREGCPPNTARATLCRKQDVCVSSEAVKRVYENIYGAPAGLRRGRARRCRPSNRTHAQMLSLARGLLLETRVPLFKGCQAVGIS
ncbi:hypothetical protein EVAR_11995_1 [Eumeta japonica]|uniref:Uncharacterized protein n=1 Tax=Eumeta variegata TaxID=151549 RepID=A0A4C1U5Y1_EUMVA|nr:hypothetical protein EVAR_11995_1 [Eumeta japonica]